MKKLAAVLIFLSAAFFAADAQNSVAKEADMKYFTSLNISDEFSVVVKKGEEYKLRTNIDERLEPYIIAYVDGDVLYLDIDRKKFAPELKKALRVPSSKTLVIEAEVTVPFVNSLEISGNSEIRYTDSIETDDFALKVTDKAKVSNMQVVCRNAEVNISKGAAVNAGIKTLSVLKISSAGISKTYIKHIGDTLSIASTGSSLVEAEIDVKGLVVDNSGMSNVKIVSGNAGNMMVDASGSAKFNAADVCVPYAYMVQSGSSRSLVNVKDTLKVNLVGNSTLEFKENPYIDLEKIVSSTLARYDASSSK